MPELKNWLCKSRHNPGKAYCKICHKDLEYKSGGAFDLKRHAVAHKSLEAIDASQPRLQFQPSQASAMSVTVQDAELIDASQPRLQFQPSQASAMSVTVQDAELCIAFFLAEHHLAFTVADHLTPLVQQLCPDSAVARKLKCARTKATAAVKVIGDEMHVDLMKESMFAMIVDEATPITVKEQVGFTVQLYDHNRATTSDYFYALCECARPTAEAIFGCFRRQLEEDNIPMDVFALATDGANVMRGRCNSFMSRLLAEQPYLFSLHCSCHFTHLCASAAVKKIPGDIEEWLRYVAYHFENSPKRCEALREIQAQLDLPQHVILKPSTTGWLSLEACVNRVLEQWDTLLQFFTTGPSKSLARTKSILKQMKKPETKYYLLFLSAILPMMNGYNKAFQRDRVEIHRLHDEQTHIIRKVLLSFLKPEAVLDVAIEDVDIDQLHHYVGDDNLFVGAKTQDYLASLPADAEFDREAFTSS